MSTEHTPGPWKVGGCKHPNYSLDQVYTEAHPLGTMPVCRLIGDVQYAPADSRLIAAAPDLLAACKSAIEALGAHGPCTHNSCKDCKRTWDKLHEAVNKATKPSA